MATEYVARERLASGDWDCGSKSGDGDIYASYSADRISEFKPIRKPFLFKGALWICIGIASGAKVGGPVCEAYKILPLLAFEAKYGGATTYADKTAWQETEDGGWSQEKDPRDDPMGFYHGMEIKYKGAIWVLEGPECEFRPAAEGAVGLGEQMGLFG